MDKTGKKIIIKYGKIDSEYETIWVNITHEELLKCAV